MKVQQVKANTSGREYKIEQGYHYTGDDYWDWWLWIDADDNSLDAIDSVIYNLHYTFNDPVRKIDTRENKFRLQTAGWGTFTIYVRINFKDDSVLQLEHELKLAYPDGNECDA